MTLSPDERKRMEEIAGPDWWKRGWPDSHKVREMASRLLAQDERIRELEEVAERKVIVGFCNGLKFFTNCQGCSANMGFLKYRLALVGKPDAEEGKT